MLVSIGMIVLSGAVGGVINALVSDNGFIKPREESAGDVTIIGLVLLATSFLEPRRPSSLGAFMEPSAMQ